MARDFSARRADAQRVPDATSPEPDRSLFESDAAYDRAWLQWAESTPGGWRARMAERAAREQKPPPRRIPVEWIDKPAADPDAGAGDAHTGHGDAPSPCCAAPVVIDPFTTEAGRGLCSNCGTLLDHVGTWWEINTRGR